jgi:IS30 family transposase
MSQDSPNSTIKSPKLLDQACNLKVIQDTIRNKHYSMKTEEAYIRWIKKYNFFHNKLRKRIKIKDRRGQLPQRVSIDQRHPVVEMKERISEWEIDTLIGKKHHGVLVTAVERKTKFTCTKHVPKKEATLVAAALINMLVPCQKLVHTLAGDNGKEFADHEKIATALNAEFYFAPRYCSWRCLSLRCEESRK